MAWSTRELAELAGTTVNTIRHYHRLGLLDEPERRFNGYKQYGVQDLVCLLRIRRLVALGVPLSQIGDVRSSGETDPELLRELDAELRTTIARLQRARADIAIVLRANAPADSPAGFARVATRLSEADRSIIHISGQIYDEQALDDVRKMVEAAENDDVSAEIDRLPADADDQARQRLAERLAPTLAQHMRDYPWLVDPTAHLSKSADVAARTFIESVVELYNPAQLDVFGRASRIAHERVIASNEVSPAEE